MIIDLILNRKDGDSYDAKTFYNSVFEYERIFKFKNYITYAMDYGTEKEVKKTLCDYVDNNGYNTDVKNYINSVEWL